VPPHEEGECSADAPDRKKHKNKNNVCYRKALNAAPFPVAKSFRRVDFPDGSPLATLDAFCPISLFAHAPLFLNQAVPSFTSTGKRHLLLLDGCLFPILLTMVCLVLISSSVDQPLVF
jgi:hypothetical protein